MSIDTGSNGGRDPLRAITVAKTIDKPITKILNHYRCIQNFQRITILAQAFQVNGKAEKTAGFITAPPLGQ